MNPGVIAAIAVCVVDSVVTLWVGMKLNATAEKQIQKGLEAMMDAAPELLAKALSGEAENGPD